MREAYLSMPKKVYLAGPISGLTYEGCNSWREYAIEELAKQNIIGVSPMRGKDYLSKEKDIADSYDTPLSCDRGIVTRDRWDITQNCGVVLVNLLGAEKISIGTMFEYGWADMVRKPVITVMEKEGNPHEHTFVREITGFRVETLEEAIKIAKAILIP